MEKGPLGMSILQNIIKDVDPNQVMNQGKLVDLD
jgi:FAD/FMN-containing dehydrogenase